uniref:Chemotaxis protein methyltransferase n=1 Tax=Bosea sp. NBC_00436 TaxID=2969620 RepID=A0A9E7ZYV8_9HYPH
MEDQLEDKHFKAIASLVERNAGIKLPQTKRTMVEGHLRKRVRTLGLGGLRDYGRFLFDQDGLGSEYVHLIDCVSTNKTDFFREPSHFTFLCETAVPTLRRLQGPRPAKLKIWSAACSIGAEAYTIAMLLQELANATPGGSSRLNFSILGTDISTQVLDAARAAIYPAAFVAPVPAPLQQRYLMRARDPAQSTVRIAPELRRKVRFEHLNLMDETYPFDRDIDMIFCRNVLIYFDQPTQFAVISRLAAHLRPGGYLVLGHSESMAGAGVPSLCSVAPTIYQAHLPKASKSAA